MLEGEVEVDEQDEKVAVDDGAMNEDEKDDPNEQYPPVHPKGSQKSLNPNDVVDDEDEGAKPKKKKKHGEKEESPNHEEAALDFADYQRRKKKLKEPIAVEEEDVQEEPYPTKPKRRKPSAAEVNAEDGACNPKRKSRKPEQEEHEAIDKWAGEELVEDFRPVRPKGTKKSLNSDVAVEDEGAKPKKKKKHVEKEQESPNHEEAAMDFADYQRKKKKVKEPLAVEEDDVQEEPVPTKPKRKKPSAAEVNAEDGACNPKRKNRKPEQEEREAIDEWAGEELVEDFRPIRPKGTKKSLNFDVVLEDEGAKPKKKKKHVEKQDSIEDVEDVVGGGGTKMRKDRNSRIGSLAMASAPKRVALQECSEEASDDNLAESGQEEIESQEAPRKSMLVFPNIEEEPMEDEETEGESLSQPEPVLKKPAGRGRGSSRGSGGGRGRGGRGEPKAKAKSKAKGKAKARAQSNQSDDQKPKRGRPLTDGKQHASSFARRVRPTTAPASARWDAIVSVFRAIIKPEIKKHGIPVYCWEERA